MSRQLIWSLGLIGGAVLIAVLMVALRPAPEAEERVDEVPLVEAVELTAASGAIPVLGSGTVQARDEVIIGVQVSGRLTYVNPNFREGGVVGAGATLLRIDQSDFENDVRIAKADVAAQDVAVLQAEQEVAIAEDELKRFEARETASASLTGGATILPPRQLENAEDAVSVSTESEEAAAQSSRLATREPQLRSALAAQERAAAGLADAELLLSRTRVRAPFRGLVRSEDAAVGSLVQPGQALGSIVSTEAYEVRISLTSEEAALIPGLLEARRARIPAFVFFNYGDQTYRWPAFVDRANAILDATTRNVEVFLRVPSPLSGGRLLDADGEPVADAPASAPPLLLGAFVNAEITGSSLASYAAIPPRAVRPGDTIWVERDGKLVVLPVRVIQRSDTLAYVTTPSLAQGGRLIVSSLRAPIEGMAVRIAGEAAQ